MQQYWPVQRNSLCRDICDEGLRQDRSDKGTPVSAGIEFDIFPLITPDEVAKLFRISKASVYRWAERGLLPAVKVGRTVRFNRQDVEQLIKTPVPNGLSPKAG